MAMDLNAKAAYIRGLMTGMDFDADSKNGKVIAAMMDLLEEMAAQVTEHDNALDQVYDELETLDQDLDDVVSDIYADEDEDDEEDAEDDSTMYEVTCPNCGQISTLDEETLMDPEGDLVCPHCGATLKARTTRLAGRTLFCGYEQCGHSVVGRKSIVWHLLRNAVFGLRGAQPSAHRCLPILHRLFADMPSV